jgi:hypothetical protein
MHECLRYLTLFSSLCLVCAIAQDLTEDLKPDLISPATARFNYYWQRTYSLNVFGEIAFNSGIDHLTSKPEFGRGLSDYACRFASGFGHKLITTSTEFGVSSLLHEDTQYRPSGLTGFLPRTKYALTHAYLAYGSSGKLEPSYGKFAGIMVSSAIEPTWRGRGHGRGFARDSWAGNPLCPSVRRQTEAQDVRTRSHCHKLFAVHHVRHGGSFHVHVRRKIP